MSSRSIDFPVVIRHTCITLRQPPVSPRKRRIDEAHKLSARQSETSGPQKRKSPGVSMERSSNRRLDLSQEHRHWHSQRISERISRASGCRCAPSGNNQQTPRQLIKSIPLETLVNHYRQHELPDMFNKTKPGPDAADEDRKSNATQVTYEGYIKKWILPRWGAFRLTDVRAVEVEKWLKTLCFKKTGLALARGSKAKIRNIMSALYSHAIRWEWADKNPITQVRQSAKRSKIPTVLSVEEIQRLFSSIKEPCRTAVILDAVSGLRVGELLGLKWEDVRFDQLELNVTRSVSRQVVTPCKTEVSRKPVPMNPEIADMLWRWRLETPYNKLGDWIFAR